MLKIEVKYNNIERALKLLRRKVRNTKQTLKIRQNKHFTKKSEIRREEIKLAAYKQEKYNEDNY
jgi:small subunit ribosomal protein S21|tara:strand:+ start:1669 stop:1860 length:192 start_codon:yes stop_codon:yes gene_type:complete